MHSPTCRCSRATRLTWYRKRTRPGYRIAPGTSLTFSASGCINFYGGSPGVPDGSLASIESLGGISGYNGPAGALVGVFVFLDDAVPDGEALPALNFSPDGIGTNFTRLTPQIGQVFFIGDGQTDKGETQTFVAPNRATRLFIGLADGSFFVGPPSCYEDHVGSFTYEMRSESASYAVAMSIPYSAAPVSLVPRSPSPTNYPKRRGEGSFSGCFRRVERLDR
ncbi:MAG: hypothetical protein J7463_07700 [Roseiflexus sp.]|nr:hypothetical protein [Roseiflexus sp.]MBO9336578.1 hypothetical protein [Roseiflexus sp.]MBO9366540.1 hypothetical protein [Roseiflexus sp.]